MAKELTTQLGYKVIQLRTEGSKFVPKERHVIVNWGTSRSPVWFVGPNVRIINKPVAVALAANKLSTFRAFQDAEFTHIPPWTTDKAVAEQWLQDGKAVVCRTILNAHSGRGILLVDSVGDLVHAPLYTQYVKKLKEFRYHVAFGEVVDIQEKRRRAGDDVESDSRIRNHQTGWVYCRGEIVEPAGIREIAVSALAALGLDFGAVDIIYNQKKEQCLVLEVNTACGLEGTTLTNYVNLIKEHVK